MTKCRNYDYELYIWFEFDEAAQKSMYDYLLPNNSAITVLEIMKNWPADIKVSDMTILLTYNNT